MERDEERLSMLGNGKIALLLILLSVGCMAMLQFREQLTGEIRFYFMMWNLFLAWLPYAASVTATFFFRNLPAGAFRYTIVAALGVLWLLFFPNAAYLTTDFVHIIANRQEYLVNGTFGYLVWYDVVLFFFFAWCGIFLGFLSFYQFHRLVALRAGKAAGWMFVAAASLLCGYGVFLGRIVRLNSWDALVDPIGLLGQVLDHVHRSGAAFSLLFSVFVAATYLFLYFLQKPSDLPSAKKQSSNAARM